MAEQGKQRAARTFVGDYRMGQESREILEESCGEVKEQPKKLCHQGVGIQPSRRALALQCRTHAQSVGIWRLALVCGSCAAVVRSVSVESVHPEERKSSKLC